MSETEHVDCVVVGAGPTGLAAAAVLALGGLSVCFVGDAAGGRTGGGAGRTHGATGDTRTAALVPAVVALLQAVGAWSSLEPLSAPLAAIRIIDATGGLLRAPEVSFDAGDIAWPCLSWNVPNAALTRALRSAATAAGAREIAGGPVRAVACHPDRVDVTLDSGVIVHASLLVAADGRNSICRDAAGIEVRRWTYDQVAIAARFAHSRPHRGISTELHCPAGPCTTVPLPGAQSSLVWVERPAEAARLSALDDGAFLAALSGRLGGFLGEICNPGPRRSFPLAGLHATTMGAARVALVGEAAHAIPPIGAQGLNLGMFDVAVLADCVLAARASKEDIAGPLTLTAYTLARAGDIRRRIAAVDLIKSSLISGWFPVSLARGVGLHALAASPALRRRLMLEGLQPHSKLPRIMMQHMAASGRQADHNAL